jgi:hypothetical protein
LDQVSYAQAFLGLLAQDQANVQQLQQALQPLRQPGLEVPPLVQQRVVARLLRLLVGKVEGPKAKVASVLLLKSLNPYKNLTPEDLAKLHQELGAADPETTCAVELLSEFSMNTLQAPLDTKMGLLRESATS